MGWNWGEAGKYGATGAGVGSMFGPWGAGIGGVAGGLFGGIKSLFNKPQDPNTWLMDPNAPWNQLGKEADIEKWLQAKKTGLKEELARATEQAGKTTWGQTFSSGMQNSSLPAQWYGKQVADINRGYGSQLADLEASGLEQLSAEKQRRAYMLMQAMQNQQNLTAEQRAELMSALGELTGQIPSNMYLWQNRNQGIPTSNKNWWEIG